MFSGKADSLNARPATTPAKHAHASVHIFEHADMFLQTSAVSKPIILDVSVYVVLINGTPEMASGSADTTGSFPESGR